MSIRRPDSVRPAAGGLTLDERVAPAAELARITGTVARRQYRTHLTVETKAGAPLWGSLVALCEGDRVLAGAAYFPAVDELVAAAPGAGCWWNGSRCRVSSVSAVADATVLTTDERFPDRPERAAGWRALARRASVSRTWGDCFGYLLVATGRAEAMCDGTLSIWDAAALQPIIEEAGGVFTDWLGAPTAFGGSAIATNRLLAEDVRSLLAQTDPSTPP